MPSGRYWTTQWTANYLFWVNFVFILHIMYAQAVSFQIATLAQSMLKGSEGLVVIKLILHQYKLHMLHFTRVFLLYCSTVDKLCEFL